MTHSLALKRSLFIVALGVLAACASPSPEPTANPTPIPSATPTPTSTPTPTPTAAPIVVADDLRSSRLATPAPQRGAPCGVVDLLDFPLGAPDGDGFAARWSFGRYSSRYRGIHTGEDWVRNSGTSLGQPVRAIGHGVVTYAEPLGWGVDRGVVIVRHTFADGTTFLSFYGHLDPPSVVLNAGDCVQRGDKVGEVGQPRGRPHLHFEIRTHLADDPGPGYWSVDPRLAGWLIPSDTIWQYRIETSPGVMWTRPFTATFSSGIGLTSGSALVALDGQRLTGVDPANGSLRWSQPISYTVYRSLLDASGVLIYLSDVGGGVHALDAVGQPVWQAEFGSAARPELMPMPGGGVIVHAAQQLIGLSAAGERRWQIDQAAPPFDWTLDGDELIFTTSAPYPVVHRLDRSGRLIWAARIGGHPVVSGDQVFVYNPSGVYRLNPETYAADLIVPLDPSSFDTGSMVARPDGGVIVAHRGPNARRLIGISAEGAVLWDRSLADVGPSLPSLLAAGDRVYALTRDGDVLWIDPATGEARRTFDGGGGTRLEGENWAFVTPEGRVLLDFRGGWIVAVEPDAVLGASSGAR